MSQFRTILIAEDSPADAEMTIDALREARLANPIVHVEDGVEALDFLLRRPSVPREAFDREVGCANGPDLIRRLREYGLGKTHLPCTRIEVIDRDGCIARPGIYWLTPQGRRAVLQWLAKRGQGGAHG